MNILVEIQKMYSSFSDKEKLIADFILQQKENINNISITELAVKTKTSPATITRFCKKIGCQSFVEMKISINKITTDNDEENEGSVFSDMYHYYNEVIKRTKELIDKRDIYNFINELKKARKIYIYGVGSSGISAWEMMQRLLRMGFNVQSVTDPHMMIITSAIVSDKDLVIGISTSGKTKAVLKSLRLCKKNKSKIVTITGFENTEMTKLSDINFLVYNTFFIDKERFINSQFSIMYLLDLICTVLLQDKNIRSIFKRTVNAIISN
ncbi:MurR/RpiR family transcriptional regulator [Haloimpatiens sp. FM7330]|uniref:MurR/RpiR family transcriptional regulator n=1 Tax=Haloimpatiens sp. FM7330 TaxID=3298610 RepID=UPI003626CB3B